MKEKKIAIFFSGRVETFEKRLELKKFIIDNNIDVFASINDNKIKHDFLDFFNVKEYLFKKFDENQILSDFNKDDLKKWLNLKINTIQKPIFIPHYLCFII